MTKTILTALAVITLALAGCSKLTEDNASAAHNVVVVDTAVKALTSVTATTNGALDSAVKSLKINASDFTTLQAAIDATPSGGTLFLPVGDYPLSGSGAQLLLIAKGITIQGEGRGSRILVAASVPATTDVIRVNSSVGEIVGLRLTDFSIQAAGGRPGRYGINLDAGPGSSIIADASISRIGIGAFGSEGLAMFGPTPPAGFDGVFTSSVTECSIVGGMLLERAGDSLTITNNKFSGHGRITINLIGQGSNTAHGFVFMFNNVTSAGGIQVLNAWQGAISYNNIELYDGATGSNNAVIDLEGNAAIPPESFEVRGNYVGPGPVGMTSIRLNRVKGTRIEGNTLPRSINGKTILTTANADRTQILYNQTQPSGELITSWLQDNGSNTHIIYLHPNTGTLTLPGRIDVQEISVGGGARITSSNHLLQYIGEIVTTAAAQNSLYDPSFKVGTLCLAVPYNPAAAAMTGVYAASGDGVVTLIHPPTAGAGFSIFCTGG